MNNKLYALIKQEIRIEQYAKEQGFTVVRKGKYFSLKEHDSVMIDPEKNCFWRNSKPGSGHSIGFGGSVIDFALEFTGQTLHNILSDFTQRVYGNGDGLPKFQKPSPTKEQSVELGVQLPTKAETMRKVFAYLIKTRKIDKDVVQEFVDRKQLYQDVNGNCVFISYGGDDRDKVTFACRRGTNTFSPFYGDVKGSDYAQGFYINNNAKIIYITESVIDAMSIMTLKKESWKDYNYFVLAGAWKLDPLQRYIANTGITEIRIATDQDDAGRSACSQIKEIIKEQRPDIDVKEELPEGEGMDWNSYLQHRKMKGGESNDPVCGK